MKTIGLSVLISGVWCMMQAEMLNSVSHYGITWTFDRNYECGRFITGDWYVVGPVTVISVMPLPSDGRNGSMCNPITGLQAYDARIPSYAESLSVHFPVSLPVNSSLVSSISLTEEDCNCSLANGTKGTRSLAGVCIPYETTRPMLKTAAVLTSVAKVPDGHGFRPGFCGTQKTIYPVSGIRWDRLPKLLPVQPQPDISYLIRGLERPWISHITDWVSRSLHPMENMLDYHEKIFDFYKDVSLVCLIDVDKRDSLVMKFIQHGIDMHAMVINGHGGSGTAKWPILFAGMMLDDKVMSAIFLNTTSKTPFREDWMTYYGDQGTSSLSSKIVTKERCWTGHVVPAGIHKGKAVMWRQEDGDPEHEHLHPSEWQQIPPSGGGCKHETYRVINSINWPGIALSVLLMQGKELWNHDAYFDYCDRWMSETTNAQFDEIKSYCGLRSGYGSAGSDFADAMWKTYRGPVDNVVRNIKKYNKEISTAMKIEYPMNSIMQFNVPGKVLSMRIVNTAGRQTYNLDSYKITSDGSISSGTLINKIAAEPGIYWYQITTETGRSYGRVVKSK